MNTTTVTFPYTNDIQSLEELYSLAWYAYSKLEQEDLYPTSELVVTLEALLDKIFMYEDRLPYILYHRGAGIGILLSLYILLRLKRREYNTCKDIIGRIIDIIDGWSWYDHNAEVIYAASLLSTVALNIDKNGLLQLAEESYKKGCSRIKEFKALQEDVENILYSILVFIELGKYKNKLREFINVLTKDYLVGRVFQDVNTLALYCITLSRVYRHLSFNQRRKNVEVVRKYLRPAIKELRKIIKHEYLTELDKEELLRLDVKAKIELAKFEIKNVGKIIRHYTILEKQKRKYGYTILTLIVYLMLISYISVDPSTRLFSQLLVSVPVCEYVIEDLTGKRIVSKAISRLANLLLKILKSAG